MTWSRVGFSAQIVGILLIALALTRAGFVGRYETWQRSEALRYTPDMENGWNWGSRAAKDGYFDLYGKVVESQKDRQKKAYGLDYVPLRLAVMTLWAKSRLDADPTIAKWQRDYAFNAPLLHFNTAMELLASAGIFAVARQWSRRQDESRQINRRWLRAEWLALAAFALAWLNTASIVSAHCRPTWDVWVLPFFIWAIWSASKNFWLTAGVLLGVGTMLKGQHLAVAPMFILWPLLSLRFGAAARFVLGFGLSIGLIISPWIVGPQLFPILLVVSAGLVPTIVWLVLKRWPIRERSMPARWIRWSTPAFVAIAMAVCVFVLGGLTDWYEIAFVYGASKFKGLEVGGASSLAGILQNRYGWSAESPVETLKLIGIEATISYVLVAIFGICMFASCLAMSRYERARDARFVLAMAVPWIVYFAIFPKMHERYLLWGALSACCAAIIGMGPTLLAIFFSLASTIMSLFQMLSRNRANEFLTEISPTAGMTVHDFIKPTFPDIGWAILLAAAVWAWIAITPALRYRLQPKPKLLAPPPGPAVSSAPADQDATRPREGLSPPDAMI